MWRELSGCEGHEQEIAKALKLSGKWGKAALANTSARNAVKRSELRFAPTDGRGECGKGLRLGVSVDLKS